MRWWRSIGKPADSAREKALSFPSPGTGLVDLNRKTAPSERKIRSYVSGDCRKSSDPNSVPIKSTGPVPGEGSKAHVRSLGPQFARPRGSGAGGGAVVIMRDAARRSDPDPRFRCP